jgi:hypothetical protein
MRRAPSQKDFVAALAVWFGGSPAYYATRIARERGYIPTGRSGLLHPPNRIEAASAIAIGLLSLGGQYRGMEEAAKVLARHHSLLVFEIADALRTGADVEYRWFSGCGRAPIAVVVTLPGVMLREMGRVVDAAAESQREAAD